MSRCDDEDFVLLEDILDDCDRNQPSGNKSGGCFIATAAYGSYSEPHVLILREFRDTVLSRTVFGKLFIRCYYKSSPPIAKMIASREYAKKFVRVLLAPIIYLIGGDDL
jgi:hypothetical protein